MLFELLFFAFLLVSVVALVGTVIAIMRGARRLAKRILWTLAASWTIYFALVSAVSVTTPQRIITMGEDQCFDEMCFAVVSADTATELGPSGRVAKATGIFYVITIRVSSHSHGRTQREGGLRGLLWDAGKIYAPSPKGQRAWESSNGATAPLTAMLNPGESVLSVQVFDLPREAASPGLVLSHGFTPGYFVIGESPIFQKPTLMRIAP